MLDLKFIRENSDRVKEALAKRGQEKDQPKIDELLQLDKERRALLTETEALKAEQNKVSKQVGAMKAKGEDPAQIFKEMKAISQKAADIDIKVGDIGKKIDQIAYAIPNIPHSEVPVGGEKANKVVREWGQPKKFDFKPRPHWEIGEKLDILDLTRGTKVTGSNFPVYKGKGALLERALINFMLDLHIEKHGYTEIAPPFLVNRDSMTGTGQLPKLEEDMYKTTGEGFFLIPTAEVPVTNLHRDEILKEEELPIYYVAYTPCFRREAGSYGKETRGITRIHQFDKVEMVKFTTPETSYAEHEKLLHNAEEVLQLLGLHYRVVNLASGDISFAAAKCYDLEVWAPGMNSYLEVSSCSNFEAFQARRAKIRYRRKSDQKTEFVHTLNASGLALPRTVIAILENYQQPDGTLHLPEALHPYLRGHTSF